MVGINRLVLAVLLSTFSLLQAVPGPAPVIVNSVSELKALAPGQYQSAQLMGYYSAGDGAGTRTLYWSSSSTATPDSCSIYKPSTNPTKGRWIWDPSGVINAKACGAVGDSSHDDYPNIAAAVTLSRTLNGTGTSLTNLTRYGAQIYFPQGVYAISQTIAVDTFPVNFNGTGMLQVTIKKRTSFTGTALFRFGDSTSGVNLQSSLKNINLNLSNSNIAAIEGFGLRDGSTFENIFVSNWAPTSVRPVIRFSSSGGTICEGMRFMNVQVICGNAFAGTPSSPIVIWDLDASNEVSIRDSKILGASNQATGVIGLRIGNGTTSKGITIDNLSVGNFNTLTTVSGTATNTSGTISSISDTSPFKVGSWVAVDSRFPSAVRAYKINAVTASSITLDTVATSSGSVNLSPRGCIGILVEKADYVWFVNDTFENIDGPAIQLGGTNTPTNVFSSPLRFYNPGVKTNTQPYIYFNSVNIFSMAAGNIDGTLTSLYANSGAIHGQCVFNTNQAPPFIGGVYSASTSKINLIAISNGRTILMGPGAGSSSSTARIAFDDANLIEADATWLSIYANKSRIRDTSGNNIFEYPATYPQLMKITSGTSAVIDAAGIRAQSSGDMADGFGGYFSFAIQDNAAVVNQIGGIRWRRNGADNTGKLNIEVMNSGTSKSALLFIPSSTGGITQATGRLETAKGTTVASANDLTLAGDGNVFTTTGTTQINRITTTDWQSGSKITLLLPASGVVADKGASTSGALARIHLSGAANFTAGANGGTCSLVYDGTDWYAVAACISW